MNDYLLRLADGLDSTSRELRRLAKIPLTEGDPPSEIRHILEMIEDHGKQLHDHRRSIITLEGTPPKVDYILGMVESQEKSLVAHHTRVWLLEQLNIADRLTRLEKDHLRTDDLGAK